MAANEGYQSGLLEYCDIYTFITVVNGFDQYSCLIRDEVLYRESVAFHKNEILQLLK